MALRPHRRRPPGGDFLGLALTPPCASRLALGFRQGQLTNPIEHANPSFEAPADPTPNAVTPENNGDSGDGAYAPPMDPLAVARRRRFAEIPERCHRRAMDNLHPLRRT